MPTPEPTTTTQPPYEPIAFDRLIAVDLRGLSQDQMRALTSEAIRRCCPLSELLGSLIDEMSRRILTPSQTSAA
jgi:hypothetical protein